MPKSSQFRAILFGLAAVLCWSTVATAFKIALQHLPVSNLVFIASVSSTLVLAIILFCRGELKTAIIDLRQHWSKSLLFGAINPLLYYHVLLMAYERLPAQVAQPINYTWAIVLALLAVPLLGHQLTKRDIIALLICYSGVVTISLGMGSIESNSTLIGLSLAIASTFIWASYWILCSRDEREPISALFQNFLVILPVLAIIGWPSDLTVNGLLAASYIGLFEMGLAFVLWLYAMKLTNNTSRISNLIFISPFISLVLIHFILGETITNHTYIGIVLIVTGLAIQNKTQSD